MKALALLPLLLLAACANFFTPDSFFAPKPIYQKINGDQLTKNFPPDSKQGWKDGCESGYAVYGTNVYKSFYGFKRDTTKVGNYEYETEWYNGYNYCRQAVNTLYNQDIFW
jgi:hypothetical protein